MANIIETAKAATIAYNDKNWDKVKAVFDEKGVYDEKATGRRMQGIGQIIEAWQGWGKAIPDSKATFVAEYGDAVLLEPPDQGFNRLAWLLPYVLGGAGATAIGLVAWKWSRRPADASTPVTAGAPVEDAALKERLDDELRDLD